MVSMSWGSSESSGEKSYDSDFTTTGITYVASTGDSGPPGEYPAYSPNVVAVGGTTLTVSGDSYVSETAWSDAGSGQSTVESEPTYQDGVQTSGYRQIPDVVFDANPNNGSGVAVYDSWDFGSSSGWASLAAPASGRLAGLA